MIATQLFVIGLRDSQNGQDTQNDGQKGQDAQNDEQSTQNPGQDQQNLPFVRQNICISLKVLLKSLLNFL